MSSGATSSAGRAKKDWGRCREGVVAMGMAKEEARKIEEQEPTNPYGNIMNKCKYLSH